MKKINVIFFVVTSAFIGMTFFFMEKIRGDYTNMQINNKSHDYVIPTNCSFKDVVDDFTSNECSPRIKNTDFRGIVINAPSEVFFKEGVTDTPFGGFTFIPICGTYAHDLGIPLGIDGEIVDSLVFVAVNCKTNKPYAGQIQWEGTPDHPDEIEEEKFKPEDMAGRTIIGYFNPNLVEVLDLPAEETEYFVYVTLGPYKSNVVKINIKER